jgi:hypothetical protein
MFPMQPERTPDATIERDPYYRPFPIDAPILIRITGGQRMYDADEHGADWGYKLVTQYSWTLAFTPSEPLEQRPADFDGVMRGGPKNQDVVDAFTDPERPPWPAIEVSGNDAVPTDGTAVVLAWPAPGQDFLWFEYGREILFEIGGYVDEDDIVNGPGLVQYYTGTEVEPAEAEATGYTFTDKPAFGLNGERLYEINRAQGIGNGTIVRGFRYPVRVDGTEDGGFLQDRPEAVITVDTEADEENEINMKQKVEWKGNYDVNGGGYVLQFTNADGLTGFTPQNDPILFTDDAASIRLQILDVIVPGTATTLFDDVEVTGDGESFVVEFKDDFRPVPMVRVALQRAVTGPFPYFFHHSVQKVTRDDSLVSGVVLDNEIAADASVQSDDLHLYRDTGITAINDPVDDGVSGYALLRATDTQQGAVSTEAQLFAGDKGFVDSVTIGVATQLDPIAQSVVVSSDLVESVLRPRITINSTTAAEDPDLKDMLLDQSQLRFRDTDGVWWRSTGVETSTEDAAALFAVSPDTLSTYRAGFWSDSDIFFRVSGCEAYAFGSDKGVASKNIPSGLEANAISIRGGIVTAVADDYHLAPAPPAGADKQMLVGFGDDMEWYDGPTFDLLGMTPSGSQVLLEVVKGIVVDVSADIADFMMVQKPTVSGKVYTSTGAGTADWLDP